MRSWGSANVLNESEVEMIEKNALRILSEIGLKLENSRMQEVLSGCGAKVDKKKERVHFSEKFVSDFLASSQRIELPNTPSISCGAGSYNQNYMPPGTTRVKPHTLDTMRDTLILGDYLDNVDRLGPGGVPSDVPALLQPLYMRIIAWKYSKKAQCSSVWNEKLRPYIVRMGEIMASNEGGNLSDYASAEVQLVSPLSMDRVGAETFVYFWERKLRVSMMSMSSAGGTSPATLAGSLALHLAENVILNILYRVFYGVNTLRFHSSVSVMDMKNGMYPFGRPEGGLIHLAMGQLARHYGASFWANTFSGDAKVPSSEAGMQKAISAIPAVIAGSDSLGTMGLLSVDEYSSPVQLVIDNEFAGALKRFARGFEINEETLAFDLIAEVGPGGLFTGTMHTVKHYRTEHWQPTIFSREMYNTWTQGDRKTDVERAKDICDYVFRNHKPICISEDTERKLLEITKEAKEELYP